MHTIESQEDQNDQAKPLAVPNAVRKELKKLPREIQESFLVSLDAICKGRDPYLELKPLFGSVGKGVYELKINGSPAYRCVYIAKLQDAVHVLHFFTKTTDQVDKKAMNTAKKRFKDLAI